MMRFAEPFKTHAVGMESVSRARGHIEDKDAVKKILEDVFVIRLKVFVSPFILSDNSQCFQPSLKRSHLSRKK